MKVQMAHCPAPALKTIMPLVANFATNVNCKKRG